MCGVTCLSPVPGWSALLVEARGKCDAQRSTQSLDHQEIRTRPGDTRADRKGAAPEVYRLFRAGRPARRIQGLRAPLRVALAPGYRLPRLRRVGGGTFGTLNNERSS